MSTSGVIITLFSIIVIVLRFKYFFFPTMSLKDFLMLKFLTKDDDNGNSSYNNTIDTSTGDTPPAGKQCFFENEDIYNKYVHSRDTNTLVTSNDKISCQNCNNYYSKIDDECINYEYDAEENDNDIFGICTSSISPTGTKCP